MGPDAADRRSISAFVRGEGRGVVSTVTPRGTPEAALVGLCALDDGTLIFNCASSARKLSNLSTNSRVAVVVGTAGDVSVQIEGTAVVATGPERQRLGAEYNRQVPGSRSLDDGFAVVAVHGDWIRVYDASTEPPVVSEVRWDPAPARSEPEK